MSTRSGIFIAYCLAEKKWLDRVQLRLKQLISGETSSIWDERRIKTSANPVAELEEILGQRQLAIVIVSELFLQSDFVLRTKLPRLLALQRDAGLKVCWVLAGHCFYDLAGFDPAEAGHDITAALDGLGLEKREIELDAVAFSVAQHLDVALPALPTGALEESPKPDFTSLDEAMATRVETLRQLRRLDRALSLGACGCAILALLAILFGWIHFFLLAGFGGFLASQAFLVNARGDFLGQGLLGLRYARSGLADATLPTRQRQPLLQRANEVVG